VKFEELASKLAMLLAPGLASTPTPLNDFSKKLAIEIYPKNFGRAIVLTEFITQVSSVFKVGTTIRVAVVGGYPLEPELLALRHLGYSTEVTIFGIESDMKYLDLNTISEKNIENRFDLILCSQVWEHIWNHGNAFHNLLSLMNSGAYLWLACPASNRAHGSPDFFSAGFTSGYFVNNLKQLGLEVISRGQLGSARNYRATHFMPEWLSVKSHQWPISNTFIGSNLTKRALYTFRYFFRNLELHLFSGKVTSDDKYATESWIFSRNP
jgi:hypothetical protein